MPLDDTYINTVVFIIGWAQKPDGELVKKPLGTGFVVSIIAPFEASVLMHSYVVTAAHGLRNEKHKTWVRFNCHDGSPHGATFDHPVPKWYFHPSKDVDVAVLPLGRIDADVGSSTVPEYAFLDAKPIDVRGPLLGDRVYFVGLLAKLLEMSEANIPMVRSGTLGRLYQEHIPVSIPNGPSFVMTGHLIDCRSYAGFSGSPCFVQYRVSAVDARTMGTVPNQDVTALLGLFAAHFEEPGVGVIVPAEAIRDALNIQELIDLRKRREQRLKDEPVEAAIADWAGIPPAGEPSSLERTADLMRGVLGVPKEEADEVHRGHQGD